MAEKGNKKKVKIKLKATNMEYLKRRQIFSQLYFSSKKEIEFFKNGETNILRFFLGNEPYKIFLIDNRILNDDVKFKFEFRAKLVGKKDYSSRAISEL